MDSTKVRHSNSLSNPSQREWIAQARSIRIEAELERRGVMLNGAGAERRGPCLWCGGFNRLAVNVRTQYWSCSTCELGGSVELVQHLNGLNFIAACRLLLGYGPPETRRTAAGPSTSKREAQTRQAAPEGRT